MAELVRVMHREDGREVFGLGDQAYPVVKLNELWDRIYAAFPQLEEVHDRDLPVASRVPACASTLRLVAHAWLDETACEWLLHLPNLQRLWCGFGFTSPKTPLTAAPLPFALTELCVHAIYGYRTQFQGLVKASSATLRSLDVSKWTALITDFSAMPALERLTLAFDDVSMAPSLMQKSLPTLQHLKTLVIRPPWDRPAGPLDIISRPEIVSLLPRTLERIDCDGMFSMEQCERLLGNGTTVRVLGVRDSVVSMQTIDPDAMATWTLSIRFSFSPRTPPPLGPGARKGASSGRPSPSCSADPEAGASGSADFAWIAKCAESFDV